MEVSSDLLSYIKKLIPRHKICMLAFKTGNLEVLKWSRKKIYLGTRYDILQAKVCPWTPSDILEAVKNGHLELIKCARENGFEWDKYSHVCITAARYGHLEILKWAREQGCDWNCCTCNSAAYNNNFEILKWARANGCD